MKKLVLTAAAVACASMVLAQTQSQNIVGYTKVTASDSQLALVALNFTPESTLVNDLIGAQLPVGSKLHIWDKTLKTYETVTYTTTRAGSSWPASAEVDLGDAFWIEVPAAGGTHDVILPGEVKIDALSTTIGGNLDATGYYFPVAATWGDTDLAAQLGEGAKLHLWSGSNYVTYTKTTTRAGTDWSSAAKLEVLNPAEGFWIEAPATAWTEAVPFTP